MLARRLEYRVRAAAASRREVGDAAGVSGVAAGGYRRGERDALPVDDEVAL